MSEQAMPGYLTPAGQVSLAWGGHPAHTSHAKASCALQTGQGHQAQRGIQLQVQLRPCTSSHTSLTAGTVAERQLLSVACPQPKADVLQDRQPAGRAPNPATSLHRLPLTLNPTGGLPVQAAIPVCKTGNANTHITGDTTPCSSSCCNAATHPSVQRTQVPNQDTHTACSCSCHRAPASHMTCPEQTAQSRKTLCGAATSCQHRLAVPASPTTDTICAAQLLLAPTPHVVPIPPPPLVWRPAAAGVQPTP